MSYPTVRNKLNELTKTLVYEDDFVEEEQQEKRREILDMLEAGEINAEETVIIRVEQQQDFWQFLLQKTVMVTLL